MFKIETTIDVQFTAQDVVIGLSDLEIVNLVKDMEVEAESWSVTVLLARHFEKLMAAALRDAPEDILKLSDEAIVAMLTDEHSEREAAEAAEAADIEEDRTT